MRIHVEDVSPEALEEGERDRIFLQSTSPEQPDIEINENDETQDQRYAVIAELITVLPEPPTPVEREEWQEPA